MEIKTALISVTDKTGLKELAGFLINNKIEIISTGGTKKYLTELGIRTTDVSTYTGFPEIMGGRLKTLHPKIHGGLLGRPGTDAYVMSVYDITPIELVVVNLYDFEGVINSEKCDLETAIENIDIGGPTMLRSAAKNFENVVVLSDINDYDDFMKTYDETGEIPHFNRLKYAEKVFNLTSRYDLAISNYLLKQI